MNYQAALEKRKAEGEQGEGKEEITLNDREEIVSLVARSFMPWDGARPDEYSAAANFEATLIAPAGLPLAERAATQANARAKPREGCNDPIAKQLARVS